MIFSIVNNIAICVTAEIARPFTRLLQDAVAQKIARPHICHGVWSRNFLRDHPRACSKMRSRKKLRDRLYVMGYGRAIFCATTHLLQDAVAQKIARPHVSHRPYLMTHMRSRKKLRDHILEQAHGRAKNCATASWSKHM